MKKAPADKPATTVPLATKFNLGLWVIVIVVVIINNDDYNEQLWSYTSDNISATQTFEKKSFEFTNTISIIYSFQKCEFVVSIASLNTK